MAHTTPNKTEASPTQLLRNLIEDATCGMASPADLDDALTLLEQTLGLSRTYAQVEEEVTA